MPDLHDSVALSRSARLERVLADLLLQSPEVEAAAVVSFDGLPMASALPAGMDEDRVAAMSAALLSLGERAAEGLGKGDLTQVYVEGENGTVFLVSADDEAVLVAVGAHRAKVGLVLFEVRRAAVAVANALRADELSFDELAPLGNDGAESRELHDLPTDQLHVTDGGSFDSYDGDSGDSGDSSDSDSGDSGDSGDSSNNQGNEDERSEPAAADDDESRSVLEGMPYHATLPSRSSSGSESADDRATRTAAAFNGWASSGNSRHSDKPSLVTDVTTDKPTDRGRRGTL